MYGVRVSGVDLVIRGGRVVTPGGVLSADVAVSGGLIAAVGRGLTEVASGSRIVDAADCYVLPGGVDPHCHLLADLASSSRAAALGGTTTALSFSLPHQNEDTVAAFRRARDQVAAGAAIVDIGLHAMCYRPEQLTVSDVAELVALGADAIKVYLAYPELGIMTTGAGLYRTMLAAAGAGLPVQVHCEDGELIEGLVIEAAAAHRHGPVTFAEVRPPSAEEVAVHRALTIAELAGARIYLTHLSNAEAVGHVRAARAAGNTAISAEACLHHLLLAVDEYAGPASGQLLVAPPLRGMEHVAAVREALRDGTLDTVGSDHSQERAAVDPRICPDGNLEYGIAGIGARMPLLLSWGARQGIAIERLAHVLSTGPAEAFGYGPRKGRIAVGSDADLVVWDPAPEWTVATDSFEDGTGTSPYRGTVVRGRIRLVSLRGRVLAQDGELTGSLEAGRLVTTRRTGRRE